MRAIVCPAYGPPDVLRLKNVEKPVPNAREVCIRVAASTVTRYDCWARSCRAHTGLVLLMRLWFGLTKPRQPILGTELSGTVDCTGSKVRSFDKGDPVFAYPGIQMGGHAEYCCVPEEAVAALPENLSYGEAAGVLQGALTALFFLRRAKLGQAQHILIFGASGGVGLYAVQLARHYFGASVTGVCSASKMALVRSAGADDVIDYTSEVLTARRRTYDVIFDTFGKSTFSLSHSLKRDGTMLFATFGRSQLLLLLRLKMTSRKKVLSPLLKVTKEDLMTLRTLIREGILKPFVDCSFPLANAADAHAYVESGQKKGSVILSLNPDVAP